MNSPSKKVAVVTGASRGIGLETARLLQASDYEVFGLSRGAAEQACFRQIPCDMSSEQAVRAALSEVLAQAGRIDLLLCNAGYGIAGAIEDTALEQAKQQFSVNFFGTCACIKQALPALRASRGRIILVSSLAGVLPIPFQAYYSASKAALNSLALALAQEVRLFGVSVTAVLPGDAQSSFTAAREKTAAASVYDERLSRSLSVMEHDEQNGMSSLYVAQKIAAIAAKRRVRAYYNIGGKYKLFYLLQKLLPLSLVRWLVGLIYAQ